MESNEGVVRTAWLAQRVEHQIVTLDVVGSIPIPTPQAPNLCAQNARSLKAGGKRAAVHQPGIRVRAAWSNALQCMDTAFNEALFS